MSGAQNASQQTAVLYRMVTPEHICPFGLQSRDLLRRQGYCVEDHPLRSRAETDAFKARHDVKTTPQTFINGARIGGYDDLRRHFGLKVRDPDALTYTPVVALFAVAALMAVAGVYAAARDVLIAQTLQWFIAFSMCLLALMKLRDVDSFARMFLNYDLLAQRWVRYARLYPYLELIAGVLMIAGVWRWLSIPLALTIGGIGAISVVKAVYIDKRELKCACVGGDSNVPLGFISLTENLMMAGMAIWMMSM
jgi:glutaredoxin